MDTLKSMLRLKNQLRVYLDHFGYSASELSRKAGVPKQTISFWLSGGEPRKLVQLRKVAHVFGCTVDALAFGDGIEVEREIMSGEPLDLVLGDEWISGLFEIKLRRVRK